MHKGTYHNGWIIPLFISMSSVRVNAVIDDLQSGQTNSFHGAEVGLPEPSSLKQKIKSYPKKLICAGTIDFRNVTKSDT